MAAAMNEWSANNPAAVWDRLLGCYGDSLLRKFGAEPPQEWAGAINSLNEFQLQRGMRRIVNGGKPHPPSLPEFVRLCKTVGNTDGEFSDDRPQMQIEHKDDGFRGDFWDEDANTHMLGHVTRALREQRTYNREETLTLCKWKAVYARDMREWPMHNQGEIAPPEKRRENWLYCMDQAEKEISDARSKAAR